MEYEWKGFVVKNKMQDYETKVSDQNLTKVAKVIQHYQKKQFLRKTQRLIMIDQKVF